MWWPVLWEVFSHYMGYLLDSVFSYKDKLYIGVDCLRAIQRKYLFSTNFSTGIEIQIIVFIWKQGVCAIETKQK